MHILVNVFHDDSLCWCCMQKFATSEVAQLLWNLYTHATQDAIRITSLVVCCLSCENNKPSMPSYDSDVKMTFLLQALSRLCKQQAAIFQAIIEKIGLPKVLSTLAIPIARIQQAVVTMFIALAASDAKTARIVQDKVRACAFYVHCVQCDLYCYWDVSACVFELHEELAVSCRVKAHTPHVIVCT